jgi:glutamate-5-semialdehyde dehydrogenase
LTPDLSKIALQNDPLATSTAGGDGAVIGLARAARRASHLIAGLPAERRTRALGMIAAAVRDAGREVLAANRDDLERGRAAGLSEALLDRLALDERRLGQMATAIDEIAGQDDPIGRVERRETRPNGLVVERVRIPLGVVAMIYEARPNVTTDAAALCLRTGNACILRGGKEAVGSNRALGRAIAAGLGAAGLPGEAVQIFPTTEHADLAALLRCEDEIDVVIPRGGEGLIRFVAETSRIPVIKHYKGVCHVYVHAAADPAMALAICENAKVQRPGVCNAAETLLVDRAIAPSFVPALCARLAAAGVELRGDAATCALGGASVVPASDDDWGAEYLARIVAIRVVDDLDAAIDHIERYGSNHTEAIVTADPAAAERFLHGTDSSTVLWNASTRFADGGELGLGAEIGISTSKLHAYGPMGAEGLTTTRFVVRGQGQIRT